MANDQFGIKEIYASKASGQSWFLSSDPENDNRFDPDGNVSENSDGSFSVDNNDQIRMGVFTTSGYQQDAIEDDHGELDIDAGGRGYMQSPNDWRDVEMTGAFNMVSGDDDELSLYCRGGRHTSSRPCEGFKYQTRVHIDNGRVDFAKEQWHVSYAFSTLSSTSPFGGSIRNKWILLKFVIFNVKPAGSSRTHVRMEMWANPSFDKITWIKAFDLTDAGGVGDAGEECGGTDDQIGNWGGPIAAFRWDNQDDVRWKWLSVREIQPTASVPDDPDVPNDDPVPPPPPELGQIASQTSHRFSIGAFIVATCDGEVTNEPPSDPVPPTPPGTPDPPSSSRITTYISDYWRVP